MKHFFFSCCLFLFGTIVSAQSPAFPFPQNAPYAAGVIKPNHLTQAVRNQQVRNFYNVWKSRYIVQGCQAGQYYVFYNLEGGNGANLSISEGQGYGMVVTALMAGYDANAKTIFDGLYQYYKAHPSNINPVFMCWRQGANCVSNGSDSATDGDFDIAYSLLLADKQWGSAGAINYLSEAQTLINALKSTVIHPTQNNIQLGDWGTGTTGVFQNSTRTSDFMIDHIRVFKNAAQDAAWDAVRTKCYSIMNYIQATKSPVTGLMPDFVKKTNTAAPIPAQAGFLEGPNDGKYFYNACRVPWRIGTDAVVSGDANANTLLTKMNTWIKTRANNNPVMIRSGYTLTGGNIAGNNYPDLSFIAPFGVSGMISSSNQAWVNAVWDYIIAAAPADSGYYGNSIAMHCLLVMNGNWWVPNYPAPLEMPSIDRSQPKQLLKNVYPNPTKGQCKVSLDVQQIGTAYLRIINPMGQIIRTTELNIADKGQQFFNMDMSGLPAGLYHWQFRMGEKMEGGEVIVGDL